MAQAAARGCGETQGPAEAAQRAREQALRFLARREHSRWELRRKLAIRGHDANVSDEVIAALAQAGLQSDARFAENYVRSAIGRGQGPAKIHANLRARGIDAEGADNALNMDVDWSRLAQAALVKRFGEQPPRGRAAWGQRARFLAGRGYPADLSARVARMIANRYEFDEV